MSDDLLKSDFKDWYLHWLEKHIVAGGVSDDWTSLTFPIIAANGDLLVVWCREVFDKYEFGDDGANLSQVIDEGTELDGSEFVFLDSIMEQHNLTIDLSRLEIKNETPTNLKYGEALNNFLCGMIKIIYAIGDEHEWLDGFTDVNDLSKS